MKKSHTFKKKPALEKRMGDEQEGLLIAHYGATAEVETSNGVIERCHIRKNLADVITGDRVLWRHEKENVNVIVDHLPRASLLARPEKNGKLKAIAANIDALIIVTAPPPALSEYLLDRYLVAAENVNIQPVILVNKIDLLDVSNETEVKKRLAIYENIGYPVLYSSTRTQQGIASLREFLHNKTCALVGISGVGKSSLIRALAPNEDVKVGEISPKGTGKHTTTMTRLYHLPQSGDLIDSPGVREFSLWHMDPDAILKGFIEFQPFLKECRFGDCKHIKEPHCAVQQAILDNKISQERFNSYQEILRSGHNSHYGANDRN